MKYKLRARQSAKHADQCSPVKLQMLCAFVCGFCHCTSLEPFSVAATSDRLAARSGTSSCVGLQPPAGEPSSGWGVGRELVSNRLS